MKNDIFIPMYIDKVKLFDLNSIICGGFSEFNEIAVSTDNNSNLEIKANMGFNLFKLNNALNAGVGEEENKKITGNSKYIQTSASMLANIFSELKKDKVKKTVDDCEIGDFIDVNLSFNLNSVLEILKKMKTLMSFGNQVLKLDKTKKSTNNLNAEIKTFESLIAMLDNSSNVVEFVCDQGDYIYVIYLKKEYLYHTQLERISGHELNYLAQVVDIRESYNFCDDTVLSEFSGKYISEFIEIIRNINQQDMFSKKMNLITDNNNKKVVLLDVISITRNNKDA